MGRRNKKPILLKDISFFDAGAKGVAVGKAEDGKMVMVKNAIPGDVADVQVFKKRRNYYQGNAVQFSTYSEHRTEPKCEYFGVCGGCKWQNMDYAQQLHFKEKEVLQNIKRIGGFEEFPCAPITASEETYFYRNKMEFSFSNQRWLTEEEIQNSENIEEKNALGFHLPGMWSKILDLKNCYLQADPSNAIRLFVREWTQKHHIPYFDVKAHEGVMRTLMMRNNHEGDYMLVFQLFQDFPEKESLFDDLIQAFPAIKTLLYTINPKANDSLYDLDIECYYGEGFLWETMEDLRFKISPKSFFQTNYNQAVKLYQLTRDYANLQGDELVYDLYTGTGTIAQFVAKKARKVIGIESVPQAVEDAKVNASENGIHNCEFYCGDMKNLFNLEFVNEVGTPDVIITDPPREGMHKKVVEQILALAPKRIVYISCNSATQARDLEMLKSTYDITRVHPVDMFPQTHHVENIAVLERKLTSL